MREYEKNLVSKFVSKYNTRDPFEIAEALDICVQYGHPGCSGCYLYLKKHKYIMLDEDLVGTELSMVMAHELGHAIMHPKNNCYFMRNKTLLLNSKVEIQANIFAAELLIDDEFIILNRDYTIDQMSCLSGYKRELILLKVNGIAA